MDLYLAVQDKTGVVFPIRPGVDIHADSDELRWFVDVFDIVDFIQVTRAVYNQAGPGTKVDQDADAS